ncbi:UNVERIFIED_CONTAM: hypothetical protein Sradi_6518300 [Sesamum radiatum]|uniref:Uncharacterized protein n=1 Tax=Sesamum radiatum TaxID=300843 RepID=A0AAW2JY11_SESRA
MALPGSFKCMVLFGKPSQLKDWAFARAQVQRVFAAALCMFFNGIFCCSNGLHLEKLVEPPPTRGFSGKLPKPSPALLSTVSRLHFLARGSHVHGNLKST